VKSAGKLVSHFVILEAYKCVVKYFGKIAARKISTTSSMLPALRNIIVSLLKIARACIHI